MDMCVCKCVCACACTRPSPASFVRVISGSRDFLSMWRTFHNSGLKGMSEEEADVQLSKFIIVFKYLQVISPFVSSTPTLHLRRGRTDPH